MSAGVRAVLRSRRRCAGWSAASALVGVVLFVYLLFWPVDLDPAAWRPVDPPELVGGYAVNDLLVTTTIRVELGDGARGPEDVAIDEEGMLYARLEDGRIVRTSLAGGTPEVVANTGGRPLGLDFDAQGNLWIADAYRGLLRLDASGELTVVATEHGGLPFLLTDDVVVGPDGLVYFSDASSRRPLEENVKDLLEHRGAGRLLQYDPSTGRTRLLLEGLQFANGVAVSPDGDFVLVAETGAYRIVRYWLAGPKAGVAEIFIDNLPGFPDGLSCNGRDTFWVALVSPRNALADAIHPFPWAKKLLMRLPRPMHPGPGSYGFVVGLDLEGNVRGTLQDPDGQRCRQMSSVEQIGDRLYLGSLDLTAIVIAPVPSW